MRLSLPLVLVLLASTAAGCDRSSKPEPASEPISTAASGTTTGKASGPAPAAVRRVDPRQGGAEIAMGEWAVIPEARALRPGRVTFVIRNSGKFAHGFEIKAEGGDNSGHGGGGDRFEASSTVVPPGKTTRITVTLTPGLYEIECYIGEHDDLGMQGLLTVRRGAPLVKSKAGGRSGNTVEISNFAFEPGPIALSVGQTAKWTNRDPAPHTVTQVGGGFDSGTLNRGQTFSRTFDEPGRYRYFCALHGQMKGTVVVK